MNKEKPEKTPLATLQSPWDKNDNVIWLATTLRINRNLEKFKFPHKLDPDRKKHIVSLCLNSLGSVADVKGGFSLKAEEISSLEKEFLIEHFLIFEGFSEVFQGTAFYVSKQGEFVALLNLRDHIQLQWTDCTGDLEKTLSKLIQIENNLTPSLSFAFSPKFGYLTSDPAHCGTALTVSAYLHIPALIHSKKLNEVLDKEKQEAVLTSGLQGNPDDLVGDILMVRNVYTLGISEDNIITTIRNSILRVLIAEKNYRNTIASTKDPQFIDAISRAVGLVKYSYQLETPEALSAISLLKLGIELGWVKGVYIRLANFLLFECRRAHLFYILKETQSANIAQKRAWFLREKMPNISLEIPN